MKSIIKIRPGLHQQAWMAMAISVGMLAGAATIILQKPESFPALLKVEKKKPDHSTTSIHESSLPTAQKNPPTNAPPVFMPAMADNSPAGLFARALEYQHCINVLQNGLKKRALIMAEGTEGGANPEEVHFQTGEPISEEWLDCQAKPAQNQSAADGLMEMAAAMGHEPARLKLLEVQIFQVLNTDADASSEETKAQARGLLSKLENIALTGSVEAINQMTGIMEKTGLIEDDPITFYAWKLIASKSSDSNNLQAPPTPAQIMVMGEFTERIPAGEPALMRKAEELFSQCCATLPPSQ